MTENFHKALKLYQKGSFNKSFILAKRDFKNNPNDTRYYFLFGLIFYAQNKFTDSLKNLNLSLKYHPNNVDVLITKLHCLRACSKYSAALKTLDLIESIDSRKSEIYFFYGECHLKLKNAEKAKVYFKKTLDFNQSKISFLNIANTYIENNYFLEASKILKKYPNFINDDEMILKYCKNQFKYNSNNFNEVKKLLDKFLLNNNDNCEALFALANCLVLIGKSKEAIKSFIKVTQLDYKFEEYAGHSYCQLSRLNFEINEEGISILEKRFNDISEIHNKIALGNALSNFYFKKKDFSRSSDFLKLTNKLAKRFIIKNTEWSMNEEIILFKNYKNIYKSLKFYSAKIRQNKITPIFILGLPRSGTSLVEKILSQSNVIETKGETSFLTMEIENHFPDIRSKELNEFDPLIFDEIIKKFMSFISPNNLYFTDKTPHNFLMIGTLKLLIPNSKIILCTRKVEENLFSMYQILFNSYGHEYSYDLNDLREYNKLYRGIVDFWDTEGIDYLNLNYESLIDKPEETIKNISTFLGIEFQSNMLTPHLSSTQIHTASIFQTQNPINKDSLNKWSKVKKFFDD